MNDNLPPLPEPFCNAHEDAGSYWPDTFSAAQMQAYARAAIEHQSVPAGWMMVPIEPSEAMTDATYAGQHCSDIWRDMIAAAPQPHPVQPTDSMGMPECRGPLYAPNDHHPLCSHKPQPVQGVEHCLWARNGNSRCPVPQAQPQPVQPTPTIKDYLIVQSTVPLPADFLQFWQAINSKAMTRRVLALTAWNISKHEAKKQFKTMTISKTFDNSNAENLTILDLSDKVFLRDLSTQAKEMAESPGCAPAWAATYMALEASASMLADLIKNTDVRDA